LLNQQLLKITEYSFNLRGDVPQIILSEKM